jgi:hypothetical protein
VVQKRIEHGLKHFAPLIQARRQQREQGHEKPVFAVHSSNIFLPEIDDAQA